MAPLQDYYRLLNIHISASDEEIKRAYRHLAKQYHPDINNSNDAENVFKVLNEAYRTLSNPAKRRKYDLKLRYLSYKEYRKYGVSGHHKEYSSYYSHFAAKPPDSYKPQQDLDNNSADQKFRFSEIMDKLIFYSLLSMLALGIVLGLIDLIINYRFMGLVVCILLAFVLWSAWSTKGRKK